MKPFHQWLADQREELNPTIKAGENAQAEKGSKHCVRMAGIPTFTKPPKLTEVERKATADYLINGMPTDNLEAYELAYRLSNEDNLYGLFGYAWDDVAFEDELEMFNKFIRLYIRVDLVGEV
jgi:hypothetical protein